MHVHCCPDLIPTGLGSLDVARKGARYGLQAIVLKNHFVTPLLLAQGEFAQKGAYFERCCFAWSFMGIGLDSRALARTIEVVAPEKTILFSGIGQEGKSTPVEGLAMFLETLLNFGVSQEAIERVIRGDPKRLLGLI